MARHAIFAALLVVVFCSAPAAGQELEHPIPLPSSWSLGVAGPALKLGCVAALRDPVSFREAFRAKLPGERRTCVDQLLQSLTPEPDFTAADFEKALAWDPTKQPTDPELARRMSERIGVNLAVAKALEGLALGHAIDDPSTIHHLIRCLSHPLLDVERICEDALEQLTRHQYGREVYYSSRGLPPTVEGRQRLIADWSEWENQLKNGRPIFDESLAAECDTAVAAIGVQLARCLKGTVASGYIGDWKNSKGCSSGYRQESILGFYLGSDVVSNWPSGTGLNRVGVYMFRPGIPKPRSYTPVESGLADWYAHNSDHPYTEKFPALDLEAIVLVDGSDDILRGACFLAVKEALTGLRDANRAASRQ